MRKLTCLDALQEREKLLLIHRDLLQVLVTAVNARFGRNKEEVEGRKKEGRKKNENLLTQALGRIGK